MSTRSQPRVPIVVVVCFVSGVGWGLGSCGDEAAIQQTVDGVGVALDVAAGPDADGEGVVGSETTTPVTDGAGAGITLTFETPTAGQSLSGQVTITLTASGDEPITSLFLEQPAALADDDPSPDRFTTRWDSREALNGALQLRAKALTASGEATATLDVTVDNPVTGTVAGLASLGRPVRGARVALVAYEELQEGELLDEGVTTEFGSFELDVPVEYTGLALVQVTGAGSVYEELAWDGSSFFDEGDVLETVIQLEGDVGVAGVNVNALTTLAATLAKAYAAKDPSPRSAWEDANRRLGDHILRPEALPVATTPVADLTTGAVSWPSATAAQGLFHAGLSEMARALGENKPVAVATMDVVEALRRDLGDGVFDGLDKAGSQIEILGQHPVDADTTRWDLAFHTDAFIDDGQRNASGLTYGQLAGEAGFYTLVSTDEGPLYPSDAPGQRFDERAPEVTFTSRPDGPYVTGAFDLIVDVEDDSELSSLALVKPEGVAVTAETADLVVGRLTATVDPTLTGDGELVVLVEARDASGNLGQATFTVQADATAPQLTIEPLGIFGDPAASVRGTVDDAASGVAVLSVSVNGVAVAAQVEGLNYSAGPVWETGAVKAVVVAVDEAGNQAEVESEGVYDPNPPVVAIAAPLEGAFLGGMFLVEATVSDETALGPVVARVGEAEWEMVQSGGKWVASLEAPAEDGALSVTVSVEDAAGNLGSATANYYRDALPPVVEGFVVEGGLDIEGVWWAGASTAVLLVAAGDGASGSGVSSVMYESVAGTEEADGTWRIVVPLATEGLNALALTVTDAVGNTTPHVVSVLRDMTGPECTLDTPGATFARERYWVNASPWALSGVAQDAGVGVSSVALEAEGGEGLFSAASGELAEMGAWSAELPLLAGPSTVTATCEDLLGNQGTTVFGVQLDSDAPTLALGPSVVTDEAGAVLSFNPMGQLAYNLLAASTVSLDQSCGESGAVRDCTIPFGKFVTRLAWEAEGHVSARNLPSFVPVPADQAGQSQGDEIALQYRFEGSGGVPLDSFRPVAPIDGGPRVVVAAPFIGEPALDPCELDAAKTPSGVTVRATDLAGNSTEVTWRFTMKLLAPPASLTRIDSWAEQSWDATAFSLAGDGDANTHVARLFSDAVSGQLALFKGPRVARFLAHNPSSCAVSVTLQAPPMRVWFTHERRYVPIAWNEGVCPTVCGAVPGEQGQCAYTITPYGDEATGPLTCHGYLTTSPVETQHDSPFSVRGRWWAYGDPGDLDDPNPVGLAADLQGQKVLGPGESAILDLTPQTTDSCAIGAGQVFYPGIFGGEVSRRITVLGSDCEESFGPTFDNAAICDELLPSQDPCSLNRYRAPRVLTSLNLGPRPQDTFQGADGDYPLSVKFGLPDHSDADRVHTYQHQIMYTTTWDGLPAAPASLLSAVP